VSQAGGPWASFLVDGVVQDPDDGVSSAGGHGMGPCGCTDSRNGNSVGVGTDGACYCKNDQYDGTPYDWDDALHACLIEKYYVTADVNLRANCIACLKYAVPDPVNPATGAVFRLDEDTGSSADPIPFTRYYNSTDGGAPDLRPAWRHSFSRSLQANYQSIIFRDYGGNSDPNSSGYFTDSTSACTSGFNQIKSRITNWANVTASYVNGVCVLMQGSTVVGTLPIYFASPNLPAPSPPARNTKVVRR